MEKKEIEFIIDENIQGEPVVIFWHEEDIIKRIGTLIEQESWLSENTELQLEAEISRKVYCG